MPFAATWIDLEIIILSEVSQKKKDKYFMISLICGNWKKKDANEFIHRTGMTHRHKKINLRLPKGKGGGRDKLRVWD